MFVSVKLVFYLGNELAPTQEIGLPIPSTTFSIIILKQVIIGPVIQEVSAEMIFTKMKMDQLYGLSVKCRNNFLS